ncbi:DNA helicase PcrA [Lachnoclostridium sp. An118]|uniref:DNA helicase PcrA n=1 Tax=Lachnoclostridium sp. An118 TaxID=1965547 RepID=UPI000B38A0A2|nr:DNA helicase PcrA [Lachnoclostridium sp. An118]OUQ50504.1 DNA helicase PcrA [Lachnoclostridium sp. An118]
MSIYDTLNEQQREAVYHTEGPLLILAGAGSGKTRVLTHRIAYLIEERGVNPWNILAITFTNKAAGEMRERVDDIVGFGSESIWVSTFHSTCVRILRRHIDRLGYDTNFTIYDTDDQKTLMRDICKYLQIDTKIYRERNLLAAISAAKNEMVSPEGFRLRAEGDFSRQRIASVYEEYEKQMKANNALDFDDLLVKAVQLLKTQPDVLDYYQERFRYIMVDEYQDTNNVQFQFVSTLAAKYRNLCVVGDDDQSIYKFRGADIRNILNFENVFEDAKVIKLEQNYRSTGTILDAANAVIRNNRGRKDKTLWTDNGQGEKIELRQFDTGYDEAEYIVGDIRGHVDSGDCSYNDNAVLYRTNAQSRLFEEKLVSANIPYKLVGGVNFYARREIKDLLSYLKTIDNGKDDLAVRRIINVPKRGIGLTSVNRVQEYALQRGVSFYEAVLGADLIPGIGRGLPKLESFAALIEHFRSEAEKMSILELLEDIIETTGYIEELKTEGEIEAETRIENIDELKNKAADYEESCQERGETPTLGGFLEEVALVADIDSLDEDSDYVVLMTLHSAKGLEFPHVYLAGLEDGLFPSYMTVTSDNPEELEEERRLCYVGITRAMKQLTLTCARRRMVRGETQYNKMSRFLKEIPADLLSTGMRFEREEKEEEAPRQSSWQQARQAFHTKAFSSPRPVQQFKVAGGNGPGYDVGDRVRHVKFGEGLVTAIVEGGRDYEVTVEFDSAGTKKMFAAFAKLQKI